MDSSVPHNLGPLSTFWSLLLLYARQHFECFTEIIVFKAHSNPKRETVFIAPFYRWRYKAQGDGGGLDQGGGGREKRAEEQMYLERRTNQA